MSESVAKQKALFLDRDGVIIDYVPYLNQIKQVSIPKGAGLALKQWQDAGYLLIIVTNQSGVSRGYFSIDAVGAIHRHIDQAYQKFGVQFHDKLICAHHPDDGCACRKPSPLLITQAAAQYSIDVAHSFFVGDAPSDMDCAIRAGCKPVLVLTGRGHETAARLKAEPHPQAEIVICEDLSTTTMLIPN